MDHIESNGGKTNPNLNEVFGTNEELFKHAWLQRQSLGNDELEIACECYDRELNEADMTELVRLIKSKEEQLKKRFLVDSVRITDYVFNGMFDF